MPTNTRLRICKERPPKSKTGKKVQTKIEKKGQTTEKTTGLMKCWLSATSAGLRCRALIGTPYVRALCFIENTTADALRHTNTLALGNSVCLLALSRCDQYVTCFATWSVYGRYMLDDMLALGGWCVLLLVMCAEAGPKINGSKLVLVRA